jgi:hypothetical protein
VATAHTQAEARAMAAKRIPNDRIVVLPEFSTPIFRGLDFVYAPVRDDNSMARTQLARTQSVQPARGYNFTI